MIPLKTTESNLNDLKEKLGDKEFEKNTKWMQEKGVAFLKDAVHWEI